MCVFMFSNLLYQKLNTKRCILSKSQTVSPQINMNIISEYQYAVRSENVEFCTYSPAAEVFV